VNWKTATPRRLAQAFLSGAILLAASGPGWARPLITEEVATNGRFMFETGFALSQRTDSFGDPRSTLETSYFPFHAKLGLSDNIDLNLLFEYSGQRLDSNGARLSGSQLGMFSPSLKYMISPYFGVMGIFHLKQPQREGQELPIARGNDLEALALFKAPFSWPLHLNVGYVRRANYRSNFGIASALPSTVEPGNIFESMASLEIPLGSHFSLLDEMAYYRFASEKVAGDTVLDTSGRAWDEFAGLTWAYKGWDIGAAVGFGLLDKAHSSADLTRGAGDTDYRLSVSYKLTPHRPEQ